jgi:3-oxoacyl-[acyl-carrier protein] reductase
VSALNGRVALVTGASGGIGKGIARGLADEGVDLFLTYGRHGDDAEPAAPARLVVQAHSELGGVDILVANAGTATVTGWQDIDLELWNTTLAINLTAPFLLAQQVLPAMVERGFGRVLFISSIAGLNGGVVGAHYAASKAGLHGMTHHLAPRVAGDGVTVNALAPALVGDTRMLPVDPENRTLPVPIPVGRVGRPEEVAEMAIAMLRNGYLTNKVVTLDGGILPR